MSWLPGLEPSTDPSEWLRRVARARAEGRCVRCGDEYAGPRSVCPRCIGDIAEGIEERRAERRQAGLCACGEQPAWGRQCGPCRARGYGAQRERRRPLPMFPDL